MISANREGLISILGYFALQLVGIFIGREVYQTLLFEKPSKLRETLKTKHGQQLKGKSERKLMFKLLAYILLFFIASELCNEVFGPPSRRLCNISWVIFQSWVIIIFYTSFYFYERIMTYDLPYNLAIDSVSINQLIFFASSNLLCGLINITIQTLHRTFLESVVLLLGYCMLPTLGFAIYYGPRLF